MSTRTGVEQRPGDVRDDDDSFSEENYSNSSDSLSESFSAESIADEVQDLNEDVIQDQIQQDDFFGTGQIERNMSRRQSDEEMAAAQPTPIRRRSTIVDSLKRTETFRQISKFSWWDSEMKRERLKVYSTFLRNYLILSVILTVILSIYWGSYYKREQHYDNFRILVVNGDQSEINGIQPIVGKTIEGVASNPRIQSIGKWLPGNFTREETIEEVHKQRYWAAIYVKPNISYQLYEAISQNNTQFNVTENLVEVIYETGRDLLTMQSYVMIILKNFEKAFIQGFKQTYPVLLQELPDDAKTNAISFLSKPPTFYYYDHRPVLSSVLLAPLQLGLTYLVVFAFFQFIMTIKIQLFLATKVQGFKYILLRIFISQVSYVVISLAYVVLNAAYKLDYKATFGHSGFLVLWSISYLTMASLGGLNENVALLCFTYFPPLVGGWLVLLMATNVAPTVSPMALTNHFFRYGYALPIHNSYELVKVVFCNTYKGQMGRNFGILIAWVVLSNLMIPFTMIHVSKVKARRDREAKERALEGK